MGGENKGGHDVPLGGGSNSNNIKKNKQKLTV